MANGSERREARRFTMTLPVRILPRTDGSAEFHTQTRDVSYRGLYFLANSRLDVGSEIEFVLTLPEQVTESGDVNIRCRGSVVRVESSGDHMGVAAKIERYEFLPAAAA
jgi:hypothetical protein